MHAVCNYFSTGQRPPYDTILIESINFLKSLEDYKNDAGKSKKQPSAVMRRQSCFSDFLKSMDTPWIY